MRAMHSDALKGALAAASSDAGAMMGVLADMASRLAVGPCTFCMKQFVWQQSGTCSRCLEECSGHRSTLR